MKGFSNSSPQSRKERKNENRGWEMKSWAVETIAIISHPPNSMRNGLAMVLSISYGLSFEYEGCPMVLT